MNEYTYGFMDVLLGLQWGDEGKGKHIDALLCLDKDGKLRYHNVARFQGGPNAGHTLEVGKIKFVSHMIPSGCLNKKINNYIGNGMVIDPVILMDEIKQLKKLGIDITKRLFISDRATLISPYAPLLDRAEDFRKSRKGDDKKVGTTAKGIGPAYSDKCLRIAFKAGDILSKTFFDDVAIMRNYYGAILRMYKNEYDFEFNRDALMKRVNDWYRAIKQMRKLMIIDVGAKLRKELARGRNILAEGAQGILLDVDHGDYPNVTSSSTLPANAALGLGVPFQVIRDVYGVMKPYGTKVGGGAYPSRMDPVTEEQFREAGNEYGATTGRPRMCGWLDMPALIYALELSGVNKILISKADVCPAHEVRVVLAYKSGKKILKEFPRKLDSVTGVVTRKFKGWDCSSVKNISKIDLPSSLANYLHFLKNEIELKTGKSVLIESIGIGPERSQLVKWEK